MNRSLDFSIVVVVVKLEGRNEGLLLTPSHYDTKQTHSSFKSFSVFSPGDNNMLWANCGLLISS